MIATPDTNLYRSSANTLKTDDDFISNSIATNLVDVSGHTAGSLSGAVNVMKFNTLQCGLAETAVGGPFYSGLNDNGAVFYGIAGATAGSSVFWVGVSGEDYRRMRISTNGTIVWGSGAAAVDTYLFHAGVATLGLASNLVIGTTTATANANACLDVQSTTKAFIPPRMTTTQKAAISNPVNGMVVFDSTLGKLCVYSTTWQTITSI
jgi:hypothetical protein